MSSHRPSTQAALAEINPSAFEDAAMQEVPDLAGITPDKMILQMDIHDNDEDEVDELMSSQSSICEISQEFDGDVLQARNAITASRPSLLPLEAQATDDESAPDGKRAATLSPEFHNMTTRMTPEMQSAPVKPLGESSSTASPCTSRNKVITPVAARIECELLQEFLAPSLSEDNIAPASPQIREISSDRSESAQQFFQMSSSRQGPPSSVKNSGINNPDIGTQGIRDLLDSSQLSSGRDASKVSVRFLA